METQKILRSPEQGFTLIELSIVLVIVGLISGGILVGRDMIKAAEVRSQITQIEKYSTAANVFREKYRYLPGDIPNTPATSFGLQPRGPSAGQGDGNGRIESKAPPGSAPILQGCGETLAFWVDLSTVHLIEGGFNTGSATSCWDGITDATSPTIDDLLPQAKIGNGNYVYVYSMEGNTGSYNWIGTGTNYLAISMITEIYAGWAPTSVPGLSMNQAFSIDAKIDDGMPQSGKVIAQYVPSNGQNSGPLWAGLYSAAFLNAPSNAATPGSAATCFDNGGVVGPQHYSTEQNNGEGINCALSFRF